MDARSQQNRQELDSYQEDITENALDIDRSTSSTRHFKHPPKDDPSRAILVEKCRNTTLEIINLALLCIIDRESSNGRSTPVEQSQFASKDAVVCAAEAIHRQNKPYSQISVDQRAFQSSLPSLSITQKHRLKKGRTIEGVDQRQYDAWKSIFIHNSPLLPTPPPSPPPPPVQEEVELSSLAHRAKDIQTMRDNAIFQAIWPISILNQLKEKVGIIDCSEKDFKDKMTDNVYSKLKKCLICGKDEPISFPSLSTLSSRFPPMTHFKMTPYVIFVTGERSSGVSTVAMSISKQFCGVYVPIDLALRSLCKWGQAIESLVKEIKSKEEAQEQPQKADEDTAQSASTASQGAKTAKKGDNGNSKKTSKDKSSSAATPSSEVSLSAFFNSHASDILASLPPFVFKTGSDELSQGSINMTGLCEAYVSMLLWQKVQMDGGDSWVSSEFVGDEASLSNPETSVDQFIPSSLHKGVSVAVFERFCASISLQHTPSVDIKEDEEGEGEE
ncbi:hypothetical protein ADUPG1_000299, partial [Aduncisulcus paluster]